MSEPRESDDTAPDPAAAASKTTDPRELMRIALEKKNQKSKSGAAHLDGRAKAGGEHGKAGGSRQFRRKSGG